VLNFKGRHFSLLIKIQIVRSYSISFSIFIFFVTYLLSCSVQFLYIIFLPFAEGVTSYNIPQGMVRGSTLELLDITYDGMEDQVGIFRPN
jgi:hypothetical protein